MFCEMKNLILIFVWFIVYMGGITASLNMISNKSTIENLFGCILLLAIICLSIKTKCLTTIKNKKKNEK